MRKVEGFAPTPPPPSGAKRGSTTQKKLLGGVSLQPGAVPAVGTPDPGIPNAHKKQKNKRVMAFGFGARAAWARWHPGGRQARHFGAHVAGAPSRAPRTAGLAFSPAGHHGVP